MNLRPYPEYRDTGVDWLGQVPVHWGIVPAATLFTESRERAREGDQMLSATQKYGVIPLAEFEALEHRQVTKATTNFEMRKHVEIGDFVISMRSMDGGLERSHAIGSVRSSYSVLKAGPQVDGRYFGALMKCSLYIQALRLTSNFIRDGQDLNFNHVKKVRLPLPNLEEQALIVDFLDRETTRIDILVSKKIRFIELLREKRSALITHSVIKGLNPKATMIESGVEWLGKVPAHWRVGATRRFFSFNPSKKEISTRPRSEEVSFLPMETIGETGKLDLSRTRPIAEVEAGYSYFANGDIVVAKITPCFENGKGAAVENLVGGVGFGTTELIVLRPSCHVSQAFTWWLFAAAGFRKYAAGHMEGSAGQKRVQDDWLKALHVAIPPQVEQASIVDYLRHATCRIDALVEKTERSIELLREHRIALITNAVTGKIDLRNTA